MEFCRGPRIGDHSDVPTFERFAVRDVDGGIENLLTEVLSPRAGREGASGLWIHVHGKVNAYGFQTSFRVSPIRTEAFCPTGSTWIRNPATTRGPKSS